MFSYVYVLYIFSLAYFKTLLIYVIASALEADAGTEAGGRSAVQNTGMQLDELIQRLDCGTIKLIDVREPDEIEETGSIPTSVNIPRMFTNYLYFVFDDLTWFETFY